MTQSRFFQISLFFPIVLWGLFLLIFSFTYKEGATLMIDNLYNTYRVFVPYLIFGGILWKLAYHKPYRWFILMAAIIPVLWAVFFVLFYILSTLVTAGTTEKWYVLSIMAFWAMVIAYLVESIPLLILLIFRHDFKSDVKEPETADTKFSESRSGE